MNKAFVREPEFDGRAYCPRCGALGVPVGPGPLETHVRPEQRSRLGDAAWFCSYPVCEVAYFDLFDVAVLVDQLNAPVYPKDPRQPICACFGLTTEDIEEDVREGTPTRIRRLLERSQTSEARCQSLAADGRCCMAEVRRLYMKMKDA